ncbi:polysaccharide biosynthesis tyrosine autokinase [Patulibacter medicamentivorans]|nr:polysaccharide biosynthesis tyrosine autokinase [Patulibacter medicamentivorans]
MLVPIFAVGLSLTQSDRYRAASTVLVSRQSVANQLSGTADVGLQQQSFQQVLVTQAKLARTPTVMRSAIARGGDRTRNLTVPQFRSMSTVDADADSDLLTFAVTRPDVDSAKRLVIAYAQAYVEYRRNLDSTALRRALADVDSALVEARSRRDGDTELVARLSASRQQLETRLALQTANAQVVAGPEEAPQVRPRPVRNGVLGLFVGLLVGLAGAFLRDTVDTRVRSGDEAEQELGVPILSRVPRPSGGRVGDGQLTMLSELGGAAAEAFRILRTNINFGLTTHRARTVMVTSSTQGEGKSTTIANLAVATALSGRRVAIVDLDLRRPTLASMFGASSGRGLTGVAIGDATLEEALIEVDLPAPSGGIGQPEGRLWLLPSGPTPPDPGDFVGAEPVREIVKRLREDFDVVFLDAPPLIAVSDTAVVAEYADALFLCVRLGVARRPLLRELARALERLRLPVLGQVITGAEVDDALSYQSYYTYGQPRTATPSETSTERGRASSSI